LGKTVDQKLRKRRFLTIKRIYDALSAKGVSGNDADERIARRTRSAFGTVKSWRRSLAMPGDENYELLVQMVQDLEDEDVLRGGGGTRRPAARRKVARKKKSPKPQSAVGRSSREVERMESAIVDLGSDDVLRVAAAVLNRILALQAES
jgi:hypothetical protein